MIENILFAKNKINIKDIFKTTVLLLLANYILIISSKINIPLFPIPMTMQTCGLCMVALFFSRKIALASIFLYLFEGLIGIPVFAASVAGPKVFFGSHAGYFAGFVFMVYICSSTYLKKLPFSNFINVTLIQCFAYTTLFICGVGILSLHIGIGNAIKFGLLPFVLCAIVKILSLSWLYTIVIKNRK